MKALWKGTVLAESPDTIVVEGNHYFPPRSVDPAYFQESSNHTTCPWKGVASYYNVTVGEAVNKDAAWYYPDPSEEAGHIKDYIAFWKGIEIVD